MTRTDSKKRYKAVCFIININLKNWMEQVIAINEIVREDKSKNKICMLLEADDKDFSST